jgi:hypothetical protein
VVGWASDIEAWTMADLKDHFRMGYAPNNCTMIVAGAVREADVLRLAKKYFETIPAHTPPPPLRTKEPEQQGERRVNLKRPAQAPLLVFAHHARPNTRHPPSIWHVLAMAIRGCTNAWWMPINPSSVSTSQIGISTPGCLPSARRCAGRLNAAGEGSTMNSPADPRRRGEDELTKVT